MELDELKTAWRELDRRMEAGHALTVQLLRETRLAKTRSKVRRLAWGQGLSVLIWTGVVAIVAPFWIEHRATPHFLLAGLALHAYGVLAIVLAVRQLILIATMDYAAPVVELQRQFACLRRARVRSQVWLGLPWAVLWIVATMVGARWLLGIDLYAAAPAWINWTMAFGVLCIGLMLALPRLLVRTPRGSRFVQAMLDDLAGRTMVSATRQVDEIAEFSREG